jgi:osmoprotectant transport system permease protein
MANALGPGGAGHLMGLFSDALSWLGDGANWRGDNGILYLTVRHLYITGLSLLVALAVALPVGIVLGHRRRGGGLVTVLANVSRAVPTIGLLIVLASIPTFGVSTKTAVIALALFAIPPILTNAFTGVSTVDADTVEAARGLGMSSRSVLARVELPLAVPLIAAGVRSAVLQTFATATLASFVGNPTLGTLIQVGQATQVQEEVLGGGIVLAVLAISMDLLLAGVQAWATPGGIREPRSSRRSRRTA